MNDETWTRVEVDGAGRPLRLARVRTALRIVGRGPAQAIPIDGATTLGSSRRAGIVLADPSVSRVHAELAPRDDGLWIRDLGSRNGTFVAGIRILEARLPIGAIVTLGDTKLVVEADGTTSGIELWPDDHLGQLVGGSVAMRALFAKADRVAKADCPVLLLGESGTGKELLAQAIHDASPRAAAPFVVVDCGSIPESLFESELFGHVRGAFTGALATREGALEAAQGGTVFLDEIGELPLNAQPKLLRALESRTIRRLGEPMVRPIDVRFIAATHRDLPKLAARAAFREDLYYRVSAITLDLPPLRQRLDDLPLLIEKLSGHRDAAPLLARLAEIEALPFHGNVRELRNIVERAHTLGASEALRGASPPVTAVDLVVHASRPLKTMRAELNDAFERAYLASLLERHAGNVTRAAEAAGVDRTYLHRLMRRHGVDGRPEPDRV